MLASPLAHAQTADVAAQKLDQIAARLQQIDGELQNRDLSDQQLQNLRDQVTPFDAELETIIQHLTPRLAAVKTRLEQLGAPPGPQAPPEDPQVTNDRSEQQKTYDSIDASLKRGKLLSVQVEQTVSLISARRRSLFEHSLFERSPSLVSPDLWHAMATELPYDIRSGGRIVGEWVDTAAQKLAGWRLPAFAGLLVLVFVLYWPLNRMGRWVLARESSITEPNQLYKFLAAWWIAFVIASLPIAAVLAVYGIFQTFNLLDPRYHAFTLTVGEAIALVALTAGLGRGFLSPEHANWRLIRMPDVVAETLLRLALVISALFAITRIAEAFADTIGASFVMQTAIRGIGAVIIALVIIASLWRAGTRQNGSEDVFGPLVTTTASWTGPLRVLLWAVAIAIVICALSGFLVLAGFISDQIAWVTGVTTIMVMSSGLIDAAIATTCRTSTPFGRNVAAIIGISPRSLDQLVILLGGAIRAIAFVIALLLILVPWGIQSADMPGYFRAAFYGFKVDDVTISLSGIGFALAIFAAGYAITRVVVSWLSTTYLPQTSLDIGLRNAIKTSLGYVGFSISALLSLAYVGVSFERLAIVASALSIGIGFGLQSIVNNFVSGLILLWERAIRVGDWIVVGSDEGFVRRINVRSTEIETFDRAAVIIPNSNLVTGVVKNFVRTDRVGRIKIAIAVDASADPDNVREMLNEIVQDHELVLEMPAPYVTFAGFDAAHLNFEVYCFVADVATITTTKSDLNFKIYHKLKAKGMLSGPPPSSVVTLAGMEKFEPLLHKFLAIAEIERFGKKRQAEG